MTLRRRVAGLFAAAAAALAVGGPPAQAASYASASILSVAPDAQFDHADSSVVSSDGRYAVFRGTVDGHSGLWRRDLITGALDPVAIDLPGVSAAVDPQAPSVSANGRFVAFDTEAALDPVNDTNGVWDVYVRDMNIVVSAPGAFTLASAVSGGTAALGYQPFISRLDGSHLAGWQSQPSNANPPASSGGAISGDGTKVVFSVDNVSNLVDPSQIDTPAGQVAVRDLSRDTTTLVSVQQSTPTGATPPPSCAGAAFPAVCWDDNGTNAGAVANSDAVISADASTVAWTSKLGAIEQQAAVLPGEDTLATAIGSGIDDVQALWRRIAAGPGAPTMRITGPTDPLAPGCSLSTYVSPGSVPASCAGPLNISAATLGSDFSHLALSADGYHAVLLSTGSLLGAQNDSQSQGYLIDMHPGLTRMAATRALTQGAATSTGPAPGEMPIVADAISGDAGTVLLSTSRSRFDLTSPRYTGPQRSAPAAGNELYAVDLAQDTISLVTTGYDGSPSDYTTCGTFGGTFSPSASVDGATLVFDSCAANLVFGDGNGASDVFSVGALQATPIGAPPQLPVALPPVTLPVPWQLRVTTRRLAGGGLELDVVVPAAGQLSANASAALRVRGRRGTHSSIQTIARAHRGASASGRLALRLTLPARLRRSAGRRGLGITVVVLFRPRHGPVLRVRLAQRLSAPPPRNTRSHLGGRA